MGVTNLSQLVLDTGPVLPSSNLYTGNWWFVNETTGSDGNVGSNQFPFKTLAQAQTKAVANNQDVVVFQGTVHLTSSLLWAKNQVHLIGMCDPLHVGKRARISVTGSVAFNNLVNVSASGCHFKNFGTFYGFDDTLSVGADVCWLDTGGRNCYDNVEFGGFGDATVTFGTANLTAARAFKFNTNTGETTFRDCYFGVDTLARGAANYTLEIAGNAPRMYFQNCDFAADLGSGGTAGSHVLIGSAGIDRWCIFNNCRFSSFTGGSAMAQCFNVSGSAGGQVLLDQCTIFGAITAIETSASTQVSINMSVPSTSGGKAITTV